VLPDGQQSDTYGKARPAFGAFLLTVPLLFAGFMIAQITALGARYRVTDPGTYGSRQTA
jgi:hypothetical protein